MPQPTIAIKRMNRKSLYSTLSELTNIFVSLVTINKHYDYQLNDFIHDFDLLFWDYGRYNKRSYAILYQIYTGNTGIIYNRTLYKQQSKCYNQLIFSLNTNGHEKYSFYQQVYLPSSCRSSLFLSSFRSFLNQKAMQLVYNQQEEREGEGVGLKQQQQQQQPLVMYLIDSNYQEKAGKLLNYQQLIEHIQFIYNDQVYIQYIELKKLSIYQQISLFQQADVLIGLYGDGLSNMIFLNDHSYVIELYNFEIKKNKYKKLADLYNINYYIPENACNNIKQAFLPKKYDYQALKQAKNWNYTYKIPEFIEIIKIVINKMNRNIVTGL